MVLDSQDMIFVIFYLISLIERIFRITMGDGFQIKTLENMDMELIIFMNLYEL